jgi:hypothetical protein
MKRMLAGLALVLGTAALSGCYYDPDYSYVRGNGYQGDAYYGEGPSVIYEQDYSGYYGPGYYGCCYAPGVSVGISGAWYDDSHRYRGRDRDWRGGRDEGHWDRDDRRQAERHDGGDRQDRDDWRGHRGRDDDHRH